MNEEGNTPLHYSCQHCVPGKTFTINKLLQNNCSVLIRNKAGDSPFDLAVRFNKKGTLVICGVSQVTFQDSILVSF